MSTTFKHCKCLFTKDELDQMKTRLSVVTAELRDKEEEKKSVMSQLKSEIDHMVMETKTLSNKINSGYEHRQVKCEVNTNWETGLMEVVRTDTGELVESYPIPNEMRQRDLIEDIYVEEPTDDGKEPYQEKAEPDFPDQTEIGEEMEFEDQEYTDEDENQNEPDEVEDEIVDPEEDIFDK